MNNFLILGLPRSRTAWLANFLTYDGLSCTHEGLNGCNTLQEYRSKFTDNMGDSNTGLALFDFEDLFEDFKILVIDSEIDNAIYYTKINYGVDSTEMIKALKKRLDTISCFHIPLEDINSRLEGIWDYFSPNQFDGRRAKMLTGLNVQVQDPHCFDTNAMTEMFKNEKPSKT